MFGFERPEYNGKRHLILSHRVATRLANVSDAMIWIMLSALVLFSAGYMICLVVMLFVSSDILTNIIMIMAIAAGAAFVLMLLSWIASRLTESHLSYWHAEIIGEPVSIIKTVKEEEVLLGISHVTRQRVAVTHDVDIIEGFNRCGKIVRGTRRH